MAGTGAEGGLRVLFAEDNPVNQKVGEIMLTRLGHTADIVANGAEAVTATTTHLADGRPYDVILMDVQMPIMDGLEATRRIRDQLPAEHQPRILAMTASTDLEDRRACTAAGMDGFLTKPVRREALQAALTAPGTPTPTAARTPDPGVTSAGGATTARVAAGGGGQPAQALLHSLLDRLAELRGDDPSGDALVNHLVASYRTRVPGYVDRLSAAIAATDGALVSTETHSLAGMAANVGARTVPALCAALSAAAQAGEWSNARFMLRRLERELEAVASALDQLATIGTPMVT